MLEFTILHNTDITAVYFLHITGREFVDISLDFIAEQTERDQVNASKSLGYSFLQVSPSLHENTSLQ